MSNLGKIVKYIIVILLTIFSLLMSIASCDLIAKGDYYGPVMLVLFALITVINIGEIVRIKKNKKYIFIPMLGMYIVALMTALLFEFIRQIAAGETGAIGPAITFGILETITILSMYGMNKGMSVKPTSQPNVLAKPSLQFTSFNAEWSWDNICDEYRNILLDKMSEEECSNITDVEIFFREYLEHHPEIVDKIYVYACNEFAYLFLWLLRRNGIDENAFISLLGGEMIEHFRSVALCEENPAEFIYNQMDGKISRNDILPVYAGFLDSYYERAYINIFTKQEVIREISYGKDYDEIVLKSLEGLDGPVYCREFDYDKYYIFEKRLNQRFEDYRRNSVDLMESMEDYKEDFYSHALDKNMEVKLQKELVFDDEKEELYRYADECLAEIKNMSEELLIEICNAFNDWGEEWIPEEETLTPESFKERTSSGEVQIFKPYGKELAYNLCFEADFEPEHGIHVTIKGGHVLKSGYRMDAGSPWHD